MNAAFAICVRGWALCESPEIIARELLGPSARNSTLDQVHDNWRVEDPLPSEQPGGAVRSLVSFESKTPVEVMIVPGSHGQPAPPQELGHELVKLTVGHESALVLDARCWYRVMPIQGLRILLWLYQPLAIQS